MTGPDAVSADTNPDAGTGSGLDDMPRYHAQDSFDAQTNAPSRNFRFAFTAMHFFVRDEWQEVLAHDAQGKATRGSVAAVSTATHTTTSISRDSMRLRLTLCCAAHVRL